MNESIALLLYLSIISILSVTLTAYDKLAAKWFKEARIPEKWLLFFAAVGGAAAMFLTMLVVRHKTRKPKFMITVPLFVVVHLVIIAFFVSIGFFDLSFLTYNT